MSVKAVIVKIIRLDFIRAFLYDFCHKKKDAEALRCFVDRMNMKSDSLGMRNSFWINPSGLGENGEYSHSTARDLSLMAVQSLQSELIRLTWSQKDTSISIQKPLFPPLFLRKQKRLYSTLPIQVLADRIPIIGCKTGSGDGYYALVMACSIGGNTVVGAVLNANSEADRNLGMTELMLESEKVINGHIGQNKVKSARCACSILVCNDNSIKMLIQQNSDEISVPMSTTKLMTLLTAESVLKDYSAIIRIVPNDVHGVGSGDVLHVWDRLSIQDLLLCMMVSSSNVAANAIARIAGRELIQHS